MKAIYTTVVFLLLAGLQHAYGCSASPTARIVTTPNEVVFYSGDQIQFSGTTSSANCGSINQYRWEVDDVYKSSSSTYSPTFTLASGVSEKVYKIELRVRNTYNKYNTKIIYVTVTRDNNSLYYLTDHLGSVRVTVDEQGNALTWDDYYPFGLQMEQRTQNAGDNNDQTKFTGYQKEDQGDLDLYHAGARLYDPVIARFMSIDAFDEKYPSMSPYQYAANNPVNFIDVNGDSVWQITKEVEIGGVGTGNYHLYLLLVPDNIDEFSKSEYASLLQEYTFKDESGNEQTKMGIIVRGGPKNEVPPNGKLIAKTNQGDDPAQDNQATTDLITSDLSDTDFITNILDNHTSYQGRQNRGLVPEYGLPSKSEFWGEEKNGLIFQAIIVILMLMV